MPSVGRHRARLPAVNQMPGPRPKERARLPAVNQRPGPRTQLMDCAPVGVTADRGHPFSTEQRELKETAARGMATTTTTLGVLLLLFHSASAYTAGFIKSPLSEVKLIEDSIEMHCEVIGKPTPEIQWWSVEVNDTEVMSQLYDGARQQRVNINFTYNLDAKSTISITNLSIEDTGTYECRASNDPYRNDLKKSPKVKWIRSQATVIVIEHPIIIKNLQILEPGENVKEAILSCNLTDPPSLIEGRVWRKDDVEISATKDSDSSPLMEYKLDAVDVKHSGEYTCHYFTTPTVNDTILVKAPPGVNVEKKSEHGNEGDYGVLMCWSSGYPPVENWIWSRETKTGTELLVNGTKNIAIKNMGNKTELRIFPLNIEEDQGDYFCNATNEIGARAEIIHLRVRGRFAAVWPFLGIVAEVIVLVAVIFIYEKRRKPDEISDDDEQGSAPLKSNSSTNHKDKNIRQRNSN